MPKFKQENCEVCGKPVVDSHSLPPELRDKVFRPNPDAPQDVEIDLKPQEVFGDDEEEMVN